eukprot:6280965-Prorocentrum_lima.AAC.1
METEMRSAVSKQQLSEITQNWKPFRSALADLQTMAKGSATRLASSVERAIRQEETGKQT